MKKITLTGLLIALYFGGFSQLNTTLLSHIEYNNTELNDIWGWVAPDGTEYALVGLRTGVSIVSLADPTDAKEVAFVPGANSIWRDLKTWGHYAYVTTDQGSDGLTVIDLSKLPNTAPFTRWKPVIDNTELQRCHNLYIDEKGYAYLAGCNVNSGGALFVDVKTQPGLPIYVGKGPAIYNHDIYTRNDIMYSSELNAGRVGIYDVSNKSNPTSLATQLTPFRFTHNAWLSDDEKVVYTTDERANAPITAFDISDLNNIVELDQFRPLATLGMGVIPHNVHVKDNYLMISYYTDGAVIVDAARPDNLIEVANFDTYPGPNTSGFFGAWGLYPFLPSGNILVSDINYGLYVIGTDLVRACYLEGTITDAGTGQALSDAAIKITSSLPNEAKSNLLGKYKTGQATAGVFDVSITKAGYEPKTVQVVLQNGIVTQLNVALTPLASFSVAGITVNDKNGVPISNAQVLVKNAGFSYVATTNESGNFLLPDIKVGTYDIYAAAWGFLNKIESNIQINNNKTITIPLKKGYQDDFVLDLGWQTSSEGATAGFWERGKPIGTTFGGSFSNPNADITDDLGEECFVTGNGGGDAGTDDVDNGIVRLSSPTMDLSDYQNPTISYNLWFFNAGGNSSPNDQLVVKITNGIDTLVLETVTQSAGFWRPRSEFQLNGLIDLTANMKIIFETSDLPPNFHLVEAAVDAFLVEEEFNTSVSNLDSEIIQLKAFPNPFREQTTIQYQWTERPGQAFLHIYNAIGQNIQQIAVNTQDKQTIVGTTLQTGVYFARLEINGKLSQPIKIIKVK